MRTLGIIGLDFCGSTLVSNVLSNLPGVLNVGESHWILDRNLGCRECHKMPCPVFTGAMLEELRMADLTTNSWWEIISKHTDADLIVSSDKLPKHYELFGVPDYLLFLYKDPRANIFSWCKRKFPSILENDGRLLTSLEINRGIKWWIDISSILLDWSIEQDTKITSLSLEKFSFDPKGMTNSLCGWLGLEYDPTSVDFWNRELHYIGGNHSVKRMGPERHFYNRIVVDDRWKNHISNSDSEKIMADDGIKKILSDIEILADKGKSSFFRVP